MKKRLTQVFHILIIGLTLGTSIIPMTVFADEIDPVPYTEDTLVIYEEVVGYIESAKGSENLNDITKAYESFVLLTPELNPKNFAAYVPEDQMDQVYYDMMELLYEVVPTGVRGEVITDFANVWFEILMENTNSLYAYHFTHFVENNTLDDIQEELEDLLAELNRYVYGTPSDEGIIPLPTEDELEEMIDEYFKDYVEEDFPDRATEEDIENKINDEYQQRDGSDVDGENIRHEKVGNDWYEIIEFIQDGKVIRTSRRKMSVEESYFLRVRENPNYDPYNTVSNAQFVTQRAWDYYTSDQNIQSQQTIHYTINKGDSSPYYYDTGIRVNNQGQASYEQYRDVLALISDRTDGFVVNDTTKTLIVLEGKPIVIHDSKTLYSKSELESVFEDFENVDIRIMETSIGQTGSLEESIVTNEASEVIVDGSEIQLENNPIIKNNRVLLPLREIATSLGGKVTQDDTTYIVTKEQTEVMYKLNENAIYVNGTQITLNNPPIMEDTTVMVEVGELATALGYNMVRESDSGKLNFE